MTQLKKYAENEKEELKEVLIKNLPSKIKAGNEKHLIDGLSLESVSAVATANLFNFIGNGLPNARKKIIEQNLNIARWI